MKNCAIFPASSDRIGSLNIMQAKFLARKSTPNDVNHMLRRASHIQNFIIELFRILSQAVFVFRLTKDSSPSAFQSQSPLRSIGRKTILPFDNSLLRFN